VGYLSVEQALADYAHLLTEFKVRNNATASPVISFGGSYGGMLTAWFRIKYPHIVAGGLAASAPVLQYQGLANPERFSEIITNDFATANAANPQCANQVRVSFNYESSLYLLANDDASTNSVFLYRFVTRSNLSLRWDKRPAAALC
jgi:lysosomal Pro-X carboxypeptidase